MTTDPISTAVDVVGADLPEDVVAAVLDGAFVSRTDTVSIDVQGPGAGQCLQGMLTNDVEGAGKRGFVFGALLTPKGMIVADLFVAQHANGFTLFAPAEGREALSAVIARSMPPRLAKATDVSDTRTVLRVAGPTAISVATSAKLAVPDAGRTVTATLDGIEYLAARPSLEQPFSLQLSYAHEHHAHFAAALGRAGAVAAGAEALELRRILDGWPRLGREIGEKTLPQEVRFDEIDGVSYTKGCYTGQETVARVHFRGHANRWLGGLIWESTPNAASPEVEQDAKHIGRVTSIARVDEMEAWLGLAILRRETKVGDPVLAAGADAEVVALPFEEDYSDE